jgi:hypothetical protein
LVVTGFPSSYQPLQAYRIVIRRNGGSLMVNFNATTRVGSSSTVAGTFGAVRNSAVYSGADGGVYASPRSVDSAVFQWTAPAAGTGPVNFYAAGYQGTQSSANGQTTRIVLTPSERLTGVEPPPAIAGEFSLGQNYPNPFNPNTEIRYDLSGREGATLVNEQGVGGSYVVRWNATGLASGVYLYRLEAGGFSQTKELVLLR